MNYTLVRLGAWPPRSQKEMKIIASLLAILGALKIIGMIVLLVDGNETKEALWFLKQSVYAICMLSFAGYAFSKKKTESDHA